MGLQVIGFDVSKMRTGWARLKFHSYEEITVSTDYPIICDLLEYGAIELPKDLKKCTDTDRCFAELLNYIYKQTMEIISLNDQIMVMENLNLEHRQAAKIIHQCQAVIKLAGARNKLNVDMIHNLRVKSLLNVKPKVFTADQKLYADEFKCKPVKIMMVDKINHLIRCGRIQCNNLKFKYTQQDEVDAIALSYAYLMQKYTISKKEMKHARTKS